VDYSTLASGARNDVDLHSMRVVLLSYCSKSYPGQK